MRQRFSVQPGMSHPCRAPSVYCYSGANFGVNVCRPPGSQPSSPMRAALRVSMQPRCILRACAVQLSPTYAVSVHGRSCRRCPSAYWLGQCTQNAPMFQAISVVARSVRCIRRERYVNVLIATLAYGGRPAISQRPSTSVCSFGRTSTIFHRKVSFSPHAAWIGMDCMMPLPQDQFLQYTPTLRANWQPYMACLPIF